MHPYDYEYCNGYIADLLNARRVGADFPAALESQPGVLNRQPWLRQVEENGVRLAVQLFSEATSLRPPGANISVDHLREATL